LPYCLYNPRTQPSQKAALVLAVSITAITVINSALYIQTNSAQHYLKVAAVGWVFDPVTGQTEIDPNTDEGFEKLFAQPVQSAAAQDAKFICSGEMGFYINKYTRLKWLGELAQLARQNNVYLAVGYFDMAADENRLLFMSPSGKVITEYTKSHLAPYEPGKKGSGPRSLKAIRIDNIPVGGMICQDDNFSEMTRTYGKKQVPIIALPVYDWKTVRTAHFSASIQRTIECRFAMVRAAANGITAIISPTGKVLAKIDHYTQGPGFVIASVPLRPQQTTFARLGHFPALPAAGYLIMLIIRSRRKK